MNAWDVAAGSLLITEAGGLVGNYTGESDFLHKSEIVAGNPKVYAQMIPILSRYSRTRQQAVKVQAPAAILDLNRPVLRPALRRHQHRKAASAAFSLARLHAAGFVLQSARPCLHARRRLRSVSFRSALIRAILSLCRRSSS